MKTHLKFLGLSIAAELRILKRLARKAPHAELRKEFYTTRLNQKRQSRAVHIAYGFLRGRTLDQMERPYRPSNEGHVTSKGLSRSRPDWALIESLVLENGGRYFINTQELQQKFAEFKAPSLEPVAA